MEKQMDFEYRNILKAPLSEEELLGLANLGGISIVDLINKKSKGFKDLKIDPLKISINEAVNIIMENPRTMIRPLFSDGSSIVTGFKEKEVEVLAASQ
ncbi:hypothetical protein HUE98_05625 [Candidatus Contubernalis alkalaceticus]|nr:ArsC/Spx/MgsR family protein [Candidatus Contubernalis alkalaceticus]UNC91613.1 hypothetical protein HUE98_05625 [Candidatus Contubernalis alkalaceticus]